MGWHADHDGIGRSDARRMIRGRDIDFDPFGSKHIPDPLGDPAGRSMSTGVDDEHLFHVEPPDRHSRPVRFQLSKDS